MQHQTIGKIYILEELTTEGDRIPKSSYMKIYIAIFLYTLSEENLQEIRRQRKMKGRKKRRTEASEGRQQQLIAK